MSTPSSSPDYIETNPALCRVAAAKWDWSRLAYWVVKFVVLALMCAAVAGLVYGAWALWVALGRVDWAAVWTVTRRGFYTLCLLAIFFYGARFVRAKAIQAENLNRNAGE